MSELKATPGPWRAIAHADRIPRQVYVLGEIDELCDGTICVLDECDVSPPNFTEQAVANAHLIAAAWDMYNVLELSEALSDYDEAEQWEAFRELRDAALSKARGEEQ